MLSLRTNAKNRSEATWRDVIEGCTQLLKDLTDQSIND